VTSKKVQLIALDADDAVLRTIARIASPYFETLITRDPRRFLAWLESSPDVAVVVTEHVLQTASGVTLLESARTMRPAAKRVLLTTYSDLAGIVQGLHSGAIEALVQKPFKNSELLAAILPQGMQQTTAASARRAG
jgi:DNA-binding NtrC family response regulator